MFKNEFLFCLLPCTLRVFLGLELRCFNSKDGQTSWHIKRVLLLGDSIGSMGQIETLNHLLLKPFSALVVTASPTTAIEFPETQLLTAFIMSLCIPKNILISRVVKL